MEKIYTIEGEFIIKGNSMSIEWKVNGKKQELPRKLVNWLSRDYINEVLLSAKEK